MHPKSHKVLMVNMFTHSFVVCATVCVLQWYDDNEICYDNEMENWLDTLFAHCNQTII